MGRGVPDRSHRGLPVRDGVRFGLDESRPDDRLAEAPALAYVDIPQAGVGVDAGPVEIVRGTARRAGCDREAPARGGLENLRREHLQSAGRRLGRDASKPAGTELFRGCSFDYLVAFAEVLAKTDALV